jgi:AraC-like DNA-binding protein
MRFNEVDLGWTLGVCTETPELLVCSNHEGQHLPALERIDRLERFEPLRTWGFTGHAEGQMASEISTLSRAEYTSIASRSFDTPEIIVTITRHLGHSRTKPHSHEGPYLCLVSSGDFHERGPHQDLSVSSGDVIAHPGSDVHANHFGATAVECINFAPRPAGRLNALFSASIVRPDWWSDAHILHRVRNELRTNDQWTPIALEVLAVEMLKGHARRGDASVRSSRWCSDLREFIQRESPRVPTLSELAKRSGANPAYLSRIFRAAFGTSPVELGRQHRAAWTRIQIETTIMPLSRVAAEAGYADHAHMCRDLRRRYGVAPHQLRDGD